MHKKFKIDVTVVTEAFNYYSDIGRCIPPSLYHALTLKKTGLPQVQGMYIVSN